MKLPLLAIAFLTAGYAHAQPQAKLISMVADEWCPYNCEAGGPNQGYFVELAKLVFEPAGYTVVYETMPWNRALEEVGKGKHTIAIAADEVEAPTFLFPANESSIDCNDQFYVRSDMLKHNYRDLTVLSNYVIGAIADYSYGDEIDAYIAKHRRNTDKVQMMTGEEALRQNIKKLLASRIDVLIEDPAVMNYRLKLMSTGHQHVRMRPAGTVDDTPDYCHLAFSPADPRSPQLVNLLNTTYPTLVRHGDIAKLKAKYGMNNRALRSYEEAQLDSIQPAAGALLPPPTP
ncbi:MAG: transporter substrate-binding domain-containing protein [Alphaproteobacteria bacterium]